ncbi:YbhB/YbcL family Raf kinase inhibitor-like protein [Flavobacterium sp. UMI-01]|uniref:YbhB/YbcL family Raf kinase inhibitor-like protein n=1 Tax=Flavobacterium sp. UMI-01 TaxID=1441053 RepID=UPI001C7DA0D0|nr:YbhB/YbcL family Raf kinase inhibitor-like protein [Flavobacterium sp. UMI-01]GIZ09018.1 kinase inhibitor Raf [Flavobacterium sp. UMI-01]
MKNNYLFIVILLLGMSISAQTFTLKSKELGGQATNKQLLNGFGCVGENISPQLFWENAPKGTKSFAITMYDESAPTGSGWWHWIVFDIPANLVELKANAGNPTQKLVPSTVIQSMTDFKTKGYGGPCPPEGSGFHKYLITIHALNTDKLGLDENANPALVGFMLQQHLIEKATLVFYFKK